jgi:preprotein translocase subunit SecY
VASQFGPLIAAFKLPDLRRRILWVLGLFAVYVIGLHIPMPGVNAKAMEEFMRSQGGGLLNLFDVFSGGGFRRVSILALGIMPYINASIIFQLLGLAVPGIAQLAKEGETGRKRISQMTRWLTIGLAILQALMTLLMLRSVLGLQGPFQIIPLVLTLTAGTCFLMWLGEKITDRGIGNGVSLIIFAGIVARMPYEIGVTGQAWRAGVINWVNILFLLVIWLGTVAGIVYVTKGERRITTQSAKRVVGMRVYGGGSSWLPIKVNQAGVIPIIFAIAIALLPQQIASATAGVIKGTPGEIVKFVSDALNPAHSWFGAVLYFLMVIGFTFFYTAVSFNVADVADNLKKYGSFVPGIRPGKPTEKHLDRVLTRITLAGAIFLGIIALLSYYVPTITGVTSFTVVGGTSLLILVGVALDTIQQIEAHLVMRQYEGFIR